MDVAFYSTLLPGFYSRVSSFKHFFFRHHDLPIKFDITPVGKDGPFSVSVLNEPSRENRPQKIVQKIVDTISLFRMCRGSRPAFPRSSAFGGSTAALGYRVCHRY